MEQFLIENNSKINKNNILVIKYGKKLSESIFDYRTKQSVVKKHINNIKSLYNCKQPKITHCIEYKDGNSIIYIDKSNTKFAYKLRASFDTESVRMTLLQRIDQKAIDNIEIYDDKIMYDKITFNIKDLFNIEISSIDSTEYYKISVIISKPNDINELLININKLFIG